MNGCTLKFEAVLHHVTSLPVLEKMVKWWGGILMIPRQNKGREPRDKATGLTRSPKLACE